MRKVSLHNLPSQNFLLKTLDMPTKLHKLISSPEFISSVIHDVKKNPDFPFSLPILLLPAPLPYSSGASRAS